MKRALIATTFAVACLATASSQEATVTSEQRREIEGIFKQLTQAFDKGDSKALASFYKANASRVDSTGVHQGQSQIEATLQDLIKRGVKNLSIIPQSMEPIEGGKAILVVNHFSAMVGDKPIEGNTLSIYEQEGSGWKIRALANSQLAK